jgi:hypothetical protein
MQITDYVGQMNIILEALRYIVSPYHIINSFDRLLEVLLTVHSYQKSPD